MKISTHKESSYNSSSNRIKLGIIRLGRIAGKIKYAVIDERDAWILRKFSFEGRLDFDANGDGSCIYAWCYDLFQGRKSGRYAHDIIWEFHHGGVAEGWIVTHINRVSIDNRLDNLTIVAKKSYQPYLPLFETHPEHSLYWVAMANIPLEPIEQQYKSSLSTRYVTADGHHLAREDEFLYECRYFPCTNLEQRVKQFAICGRCQEARYCCPQCQQRDWGFHRKYCQERLHEIQLDCAPER